MPSDQTPPKHNPTPAWGEPIETVAREHGLRCSNLSVGMAADMGIPCVPMADDMDAVLILWNTERRPIYVYRVSRGAIEVSAKVLQPSIQFGIGAGMNEHQIESIMKLVQGIAFMVGEGRVTVVRRRQDVEVVHGFEGPSPLDSVTIGDVLRDLMTVQNVFRQWLDGELTDPIMDLIASNYVLSVTP